MFTSENVYDTTLNGYMSNWHNYNNNINKDLALFWINQHSSCELENDMLKYNWILIETNLWLKINLNKICTWACGIAKSYCNFSKALRKGTSYRNLEQSSQNTKRK